MIKVKPLHRNINGQYMIAAIMIFCLIAVIFGIMMIFSPHLKTLINNFAAEMKNGTLEVHDKGKSLTVTFSETVFGFISQTTVKDLTFYTFTPSLVTIAYVPIAVGGAFFLWIFICWCRLTAGFKSVNKRDIKQVINPIRWYTITISSVWIGFVFVLIATFVAYMSSSFFLFGHLFLLNFSQFIPFASPLYLQNSNDTWLSLNSTDVKIFWLIGDVFSQKMANSRLTGDGNWINFVIPTVPLVVGFIFIVAGLIAGSVSWKWVNLYVLAAIGDPKALVIVNSRLSVKKQLSYTDDSLSEIDHDNVPQRRGLKAAEANETIETYAPDVFDDKNTIKPEKLSRKQRKEQARLEQQKLLAKANDNETQENETTTWNDENMQHATDTLDFNVNATLKSRCQSFFKNSIRMLELAGNTENSLYRKFQAAYDALIANRVDQKLDDIASGITDYINFATDVDQKYVELVAKVLSTNRHVFGAYSVELDELIARYNNSIKAWNLYEAELAIEQIFTITSQNTELLAKVGYCLKYRLSNHYSYIEKRTNGINRLNAARESKNYDAYRQTCLQIIKSMSPNQLMVSGLVNQVY